MDQLRTALGWLKRHHFWVLSGLAALIALGCWWSGTGSLSKQFDTNQKTIKTEFTNLESVKSASFHPNEAINERQATETKTQTAGVTKLWEQLYERQRENGAEVAGSLEQSVSRCRRKDAIRRRDSKPSFATTTRTTSSSTFRNCRSKSALASCCRMRRAVLGGEGRGRMMFSPEAGVGGIDPALDDDNYICEWVDQDVIRKDLDFPQRPRRCGFGKHRKICGSTTRC